MSYRVITGAAIVHYPSGESETVRVDIVRDEKENMVGVRIVTECPIKGMTVLVDPAWFEHARRSGRQIENLGGEA